VIALDTNLLVYAHRADSQWHDAAERTVAGLAEGTAEWAIPWPCLHEFLAIVTHPRIFKTPTPAKLAFGQVEAWLESPSLVLLSENDDYLIALRETTLAARVVGARVHDARVAALCVSHGIRELWTADRDFSLFRAIKTRNPLVG
jgi:toxin-antitoxin system PIN domain toxin